MILQLEVQKIEVRRKIMQNQVMLDSRQLVVHYKLLVYLADPN